MAVQWAIENPRDDIHADLSVGIEMSRWFTFKTAMTDRGDVLLRARPDLAPGQPHPDFPAMLVRRFHAQRRDGMNYWDAQADYSSVLPAEEEENPLERPASISVSGSAVQKNTLLDGFGRPNVNTAGDLLDAVPVEDEYAVINVSKNVADWPDWLFSFRRGTNADEVRIKGRSFPKYTLWFRSPTIGEEQFENGFSFYAAGFQLHHNPDTWVEHLISQGWNELVEKTVERNGRQVTVRRPEPILVGPPGKRVRPQKPLFLDREGKALRNDAGDATNGLDPDELNPEDPQSGVDPGKIVVLQRLFLVPMSFNGLPLA